MLGLRPSAEVHLSALQALDGLAQAQTEHLVAERLNRRRFCRLDPSDLARDADTLWGLRHALFATGALKRIFARPNEAIHHDG